MDSSSISQIWSFVGLAFVFGFVAGFLVKTLISIGSYKN
jgi:hypothetical protein